MNYDVIVIGAGSIGMAAGYFLAREGKKTLLLDAYNPPHNKGSHHGETRIIRHAYGEGEAYVPLALEAQRLWNELEEETGKQLFLKTGVVNVGYEHSKFMKNIISSSNKYSLPVEILDATEVMNRWTGITLPIDYIGLYEPTSGVLKSEVCIEAYRERAEEHGATVLTNRKVTDLSISNDHVSVQAGNETFHASSVVIAAGAWSKEILSILQLDLPLHPVRKTFAWFEVDEKMYSDNVFPAFSFETKNGHYYGFPSIGRAGLKLGRNDGGEPIHPDENIASFGERHEDENELTGFLQQYMPRVKQIKYGKTCMYTLTPDEDFIIDLHPDYENVVIATGFSGHGFKFSSVIGKIVSDLIVTGKTEHNITPFSMKRFR